jgi:dihydrodipicolinate synthase/N-acetylneuraminate lyase
LAELEQVPEIVAVKEFSGDVRRVAAVLERTRLAVIAWTDDLVVESLAAGAEKWIAGLANVVPEAAVTLFDAARAGRWPEAWRLYRQLLPLLRYDSMPRLVHAIKYGLQLRGRGIGDPRPPRLPLGNDERAALEEALRRAMTGATDSPSS